MVMFGLLGSGFVLIYPLCPNCRVKELYAFVHSWAVLYGLHAMQLCTQLVPFHNIITCLKNLILFFFIFVENSFENDIILLASLCFLMVHVDKIAKKMEMEQEKGLKTKIILYLIRLM